MRSVQASTGLCPAYYFMNCYYHQNRTAVATCQDCGKYLCKECAEKYNKESVSHGLILCDACYIERIIGFRRSFVKKTAIGFLLALIGYIIIYNAFWVGMGYAFLLILLPFGWVRREVSETEAALRATGNVKATIFDVILFVVKIAISAIRAIPFFIRDVIQLVKYSIQERNIANSGTLS